MNFNDIVKALIIHEIVRFIFYLVCNISNTILDIYYNSENNSLIS